MSRIKALFFDIDGTLVPFGTGSIPRHVSEAIAEVRRKGIKVFISTGRHIEWINNLGDTEFDGYVTVNGGMAIAQDKKTCIFKNCIPRTDIERLSHFDSTSSLPFVVVPAEGGIFITKVNDKVCRISDELHLPELDIKPVSAALDTDVVQLMAFGTKEEREESGLFTDVILESVPTSWNPYFCDIIPKESNKGVGIRRMAENYGIDLSETMAFGDGSNDIEMLQAAGIGVAMGNAGDDVKAVADYVTTADTDNGIINALRHFGILD